MPGDGVTGFRSRWTEPTVSGTPDDHVVIWVGIGGWDATYNNIVQVGTLASVLPDRSVQHIVWWETLPPNHWNLTSVAVAPGDEIEATVELVQASPQRWRMTLRDLTSGRSFETTATFRSDQEFADFIVESPNATANNGPPYYSLPDFAPVTFTNAQVRYGQRWTSLEDLRVMRVTLQRGGVTLARAGDLAGSSFTVTRGGQ